MISKSQISLVKSLQQKKHRKEQQLFLVEGLKAIKEFLNSNYALHSIYVVTDMIPNLPKLSDKQKVFEISQQELEKISALQTPQGVLALFRIPAFTDYKSSEIADLTFYFASKKQSLVFQAIK
jgi:TrmH family RNA methyltransferase